MRQNFLDYGLEGKVVLITGASSGLGKIFSHTFARANARVIIAARRFELLENLSDEIKKYNKNIISIELNLLEQSSIESLINKSHQHFGAIDVLVNNAGITIEKNSFLEHSLDDWSKVLNTNLTGTWLMTQSIAKQMISHDIQGSIINISSIAGTRAHVQSSPAYAASKAGINHLTRALCCELAQWGIRINTLAPGGIITGESTWQNEAFARKLTERIPLKRFGESDELNGALLFLASHLSHYMTGGLLQIDGGLSANQL